jgi:import receptor subunit TOM22
MPISTASALPEIYIVFTTSNLLNTRKALETEDLDIDPVVRHTFTATLWLRKKEFIVTMASSGSLLGQSTYAGAKLFNSFKKAAWITTTTVLILLVPLIIEMDREQQIVDMEKEQMNVLTAPKTA